MSEPRRWTIEGGMRSGVGFAQRDNLLDGPKLELREKVRVIELTPAVEFASDVDMRKLFNALMDRAEKAEAELAELRAAVQVVIGVVEGDGPECDCKYCALRRVLEGGLSCMSEPREETPMSSIVEAVPAVQDCASNYGVFKVLGSDGVTEYTVTFGGSEGPEHCTCKAYQYSGDNRHCKHIDKVYKGACMYNAQWNDGNIKPDYRPVSYTYDMFCGDERCPWCKGPMVYVRRAV